MHWHSSDYHPALWHRRLVRASGGGTSSPHVGSGVVIDPGEREGQNSDMFASTSRVANVHGRRWGRGWRPWLLIPKLFCVAVATGGLVSLLVLVFARPVPENAAGWQQESLLITRMYRFVVVPALVGAMLFGLLLAFFHLRAFLRMRWFQVKLVLIAVCVPGLHTFMYRKSMAFKAALVDPPDPAAAAVLRGHLFAGTLAALAFVLTAMILGRIKPRLGQDYGRTFAKQPSL